MVLFHLPRWSDKGSLSCHHLSLFFLSFFFYPEGCGYLLKQIQNNKPMHWSKCGSERGASVRTNCYRFDCDNVNKLDPTHCRLVQRSAMLSLCKMSWQFVLCHHPSGCLTVTMSINRCIIMWMAYDDINRDSDESKVSLFSRLMCYLIAHNQSLVINVILLQGMWWVMFFFYFSFL